VSFDGHRSDHFEPFIFVTEDYGKKWKRITKGFDKDESVRVVREDHKNPNLLFAGTETGVWVSINRGKSWQRLKLNMPTVSIYDLKIHERENDLIVGTHGRSLWILDDISPLQQLADIDQKSKVHLFDQKENTLWNNISRGGQRGHFWWAGDNPKTIKNTSSLPRAGFMNLAAITYYVGEGVTDSLNLKIESVLNNKSVNLTLDPSPGIHRIYWNREFEDRDFTDDDLAELDQILASVVNEIGNSRVKRIYAQFQKETSSNKIRRLIAPLTGGYLNFDFDEKFLI